MISGPYPKPGRYGIITLKGYYTFYLFKAVFLPGCAGNRKTYFDSRPLSAAPSPFSQLREYMGIYNFLYDGPGRASGFGGKQT